MNKFALLVLVSILSFTFPLATFAGSGGIINNGRYAEFTGSSNYGRVNFSSTQGQPVHISETGGITGNAWSETFGWISFSGSHFQTDIHCNRHGWAIMDGYAWGQNTGWINMNAYRAMNSGGFPYAFSAAIDSDGNFHGYVWAENGGWISFESACQNGGCIQTSFRCSRDTSAVFGNPGPACKILPEVNPVFDGSTLVFDVVTSDADTVTVGNDTRSTNGSQTFSTTVTGQTTLSATVSNSTTGQVSHCSLPLVVKSL
jgi:hypothetical protein